MDKYEKILGGILGAAVGDAMGAATEMRTTEQIIDCFGGYVKELVNPPADTFAKGNAAGQVTDDFSLAYFISEAIIRHRGEVTEAVVMEGLIEWSEHDEYFVPFAGPTTRAAITAWKENGAPVASDMILNNGRATNGSAMRMFPIGLIRPGDLDRAIEDAVVASLPTHGNHLSISGACAVAAAVSRAMQDDADVDEIVFAGLYGAKQGERRGKELGVTVAGPSVYKRMELAIDLAAKSGSVYEAMRDLADYVGSGIHVAEAVPAAFGLFVAAKGDTMETIYGGVNIGNDTDTVATIAGAIAGTLNGSRSLPESYLSIINERNNMDLGRLAKGLHQVSGG